MARFKPILLCVLALLLATPAAAQVDDSSEWIFRVYLDDREIGFHKFRVETDGERQEVSIEARFDVRILFFNAYSYEHANIEVWESGCLSDLRSRTNDNGTTLTVLGSADREAFRIDTREGSNAIDSDCVRSFAYWNPEFLQAGQLLNAQTGEVMNVDLEPGGIETIELGDMAYDAVRYTLETEEGPIRLWYTPDEMQWLALEAPAEGGRTIRYEPVALPFPPRTDNRLAMD
jgi:hypothetical protein